MLDGALAILLTILLAQNSTIAPGDPDADRDGLSDFREVHKHFTDPKSADSDGDGTPDGDWSERREFAYTVRSLLRVMRPCNENELTDDYQDARVLARSDRYVEIEVVHYPLNTCAAGIVGTEDWQPAAARMQDYLKPGVTTNWDAAMRRDLLSNLEKAGIHPDRMTDRDAATRVAVWALKNTRPHSNFNAFHVYYPDNVPTVYPGREAGVRADMGDPKWTFREQFEHEILGREMYNHRTRGTCTSTAVYLTTVLRAAGIPTRMIICTPLVDASGGDNIELVRSGIKQPEVRRIVLDALAPLKNSNASHTFNEVFVGGRWRRLNGDRLGQSTLDRALFGLITHVHTFNDLSEAELVRWGGRTPDEMFRYSNPYSALEVSDQIGVHCTEANAMLPSAGIKVLTIRKTCWLESPDLPKCVRGSQFDSDGSGHLFLHVDDPDGAGGDDYRAFYESASKQFRLKAKDQPPIAANAERGYWIDPNEDCREFYIRIAPEERAKMKTGVKYALEVVTQNDSAQWKVAAGMEITLPASKPADAKKGPQLRITKVRWLDSEDLPPNVRDSQFASDGSGHLFLHAEKLGNDSMAAYKPVYEAAAKDFRLVAAGQPDVQAKAERGYWIAPDKDCREFYVRIPPEEMKKMKSGVEYELKPTTGDSWAIAPKLRITRR